MQTMDAIVPTFLSTPKRTQEQLGLRACTAHSIKANNNQPAKQIISAFEKTKPNKTARSSLSF
jgi:hypothetical protein